MRYRSRVHTNHGDGRHALFKAGLMRQEHKKRHQEREKLLLYSQNLITRQRQADVFNEIHRIEGMLSNTNPFLAREYISHARHAELGTAKDQLRASLGPRPVDSINVELW